MSGIYTVQFNSVDISAQQDLFELVASSGKPIVILGFGLSQHTEIGDAQEEQLLILVKSGQTVSGSGGSSATPVPTDSSGSAASFTAEVNNTTKANTGTIVTHKPYAWNVRAPLDIVFTELEQLVMAVSRRCTIELAKTPADQLTCNGYVVVQEIG